MAPKRSRLRNQVEERGLMENKDMVVLGQKPNPNAFWCPKCCGHTDSAERETYVGGGGSQGGSGYLKVVDTCVSCEAVGGIPAKQYESIIRDTTKIVLFATTSAAILACCIGTFADIISSTLWLTLFFSPFMLFAWVVTCGSTFLRYRKWRTWVGKQR